MQSERVYSFDLGSGSIGLCVREGKDVLLLDSLLIDNEFASVKQVALRRRQIVQELLTKKEKSGGINRQEPQELKCCQLLSRQRKIQI